MPVPQLPLCYCRSRFHSSLKYAEVVVPDEEQEPEEALVLGGRDKRRRASRNSPTQVQVQVQVQQVCARP